MSESKGNSGRVVVGVDGSAGSLAALDSPLTRLRAEVPGYSSCPLFDLPVVWSLTYGLPVTCTVEDIQHSVLDHARRVVAEALGDRTTANGVPDVRPDRDLDRSAGQPRGPTGDAGVVAR